MYLQPCKSSRKLKRKRPPKPQKKKWKKSQKIPRIMKPTRMHKPLLFILKCHIMHKNTEKEYYGYFKIEIR